MLDLNNNYKTKKALKASKGQPLQFNETSMFGPEFKTNGTVVVVGPCAYTKRDWFARVTMRNGLIHRID